MVAEPPFNNKSTSDCCSLAKISMVAELSEMQYAHKWRCSLAKISMVAEHIPYIYDNGKGCSLAKISMVAEQNCLCSL